MSSKVLNPETGFLINFMGATHKRLIKQGKIRGNAEIFPSSVAPQSHRQRKSPRAKPTKKIRIEPSESYSYSYSSEEEVPIRQPRAKAKRTKDEQRKLDERMAKMRNARRR